MRIKYNRTSTLLQDGKRFELDKDLYDLTLFDRELVVLFRFQKERMERK